MNHAGKANQCDMSTQGGGGHEAVAGMDDARGSISYTAPRRIASPRHREEVASARPKGTNVDQSTIGFIY